MAGEAHPSRLDMWIPWLLIPPSTLAIALGQPLPIAWERFMLEVLFCVMMAGLLSQMHSFPRLRHPIWAPVAMIWAATIRLGGSGVWAGGLYVLGLAVLTLGGAQWLVSRRRVPGWLCAVMIPVLAVGVHASQRFEQALAQDTSWVSDLGEDLMWPVRGHTLAAPQDAGPPIILITVDTLRADAAAQMKSVQRLSDGGARWDSAMSTSSWTLPALASIQTGVMPGVHGAGCLANFHCQGLRPDIPTVAEDLGERGYRTAAVNANPWAGEDNGLRRGFQWFIDLANERPRRFAFSGEAYSGAHPQDGSVVVDLALEQLAELQGGSMYLWAHAMDPHMPYVHSDNPAFHSMTISFLRDPYVLTEEFRDSVRHAYANEVASVDQELMRLLDGIEDAGLWDEALIILTSDHGEEFWEHGGVEHGHSHHGEVVEVPLVLRGPGVTPGMRSGTVSIMDVASTIRHAAGIPNSGVDLRTGGIDADRAVSAQGELVLWRRCSARDGDERVIIDACGDSDDERIRLYDLSADPGEHWPSRAPLDSTVRGEALRVQLPEKRSQSAQNIQALRALGYVD